LYCNEVVVEFRGLQPTLNGCESARVFGVRFGFMPKIKWIRHVTRFIHLLVAFLS
jgi:hypothetical protein